MDVSSTAPYFQFFMRGIGFLLNTNGSMMQYSDYTFLADEIYNDGTAPTINSDGVKRGSDWNFSINGNSGL